MPNRNQNWYLHTSKIQFLLPVSFTIERKVGIVEFYLYTEFGAGLLLNVVAKARKLPKSASAHL